MIVTAGELSLISPDDNEQAIPVESYLIHPGYNNVTKLNDIAILMVISSLSCEYFGHFKSI